MGSQAVRIGRFWKTGVLVACAMAFIGTGLMSGSAAAQERKRPTTLMEMLFGGQKVERKKSAVTNQRPKKKSSIVRVSPPEPEAVVKVETARTVMVIGDFLGGGMAEGLVAVYAQNANVQVLDRTRSNSGFVRDDVYNWPAEVKGLIEAEKPAAIVVMLGSNDRQQMKVGDIREAAMSEKWIAEYTARTTALATAIKDTNVPIFWVGMPPFKSAKMSLDMIALNDIYKKAAEDAGGAYVDIWDGFVDESGAFVTSGPDVNGQPVRLRGSDGINFSKAGKRKIAFYAEKPLAKIFGDGTQPMMTLPGAGAPVAALTPGNLTAIERTQPVSLMDPELDGGTELLGLKVEAKKGEAISLGEKLSINGVAPAATPGRADDFGGNTAPAPTQAASQPAPIIQPIEDTAATEIPATAVNQ